MPSVNLTRVQENWVMNTWHCDDCEEIEFYIGDYRGEGKECLVIGYGDSKELAKKDAISKLKHLYNEIANYLKYCDKE